MDLRKPKIHRGFGLINEVGLSDIITQKRSFSETIHEINPHLGVLTAGTKLPFPAEFLMSEKLKDLFEELKKVYDRIIVDTPPMTAVTDASIISTFVDGVIIVIASRQTPIDAAKHAIKDLTEHGANIIGSVLTRVQKRESHYLNYYSYYYEDKTSKE
jgi:capsular exopolysaccharide synthesis family protein